MTPARINSIASRSKIAAAVALILGATIAPVAMADDAADLAALKQQLQALQHKVDTLQQQQAQAAQQAAQQTAPAAASSTAAATPAASGPSFRTGPVTVTFGGFTELASIYRNKSESTDVGSSFNGIPMANNEQSNVSEFRESARQSRLSILAQTDDLGGYKAEAWYEMDFLGAAPTANSNESNSYQPRIRNIYGRFISDNGWYVLAGQNWSLATLEKSGMDPRNENVPLTIDAQYVAGFDWTRNPQLRLVGKISDGLWAGLSLESPQATGIISTNNLATNGVKGTLPASPTTGFAGTGQLGNGGGTCSATTTTTIAGAADATDGTAPTASSSSTCSISGTSFSSDIAPDVIAKIAADPGYGHYELYGMARFFRSAIGADNQTTAGGGVGAGVILPLVPNNVLTFQLSGLIGKGIGRYGSASLNDVVVKPDGQLSAVGAYHVMAGLIYNPVPDLQTYLYAGREQQQRTLYSYSTAAVGPYWYGLGIPNLNNSGCYTLNGTCSGQNQKVDEVTGGFWWKFYKGPLGNAQFGLQLGYIQRTLFGTTNGGSPEAGMFEGMASFRIYPFQK